MTTEIGYGFFPGGDPRKFQPDEECNSDEEIEAWKVACAEWDKGNEVSVGSSCVVGGGAIFTIAPLGVGIYEYEAEEPDEDDAS